MINKIRIDDCKSKIFKKLLICIHSKRLRPLVRKWRKQEIKHKEIQCLLEFLEFYK